MRRLLPKSKFCNFCISGFPASLQTGRLFNIPPKFDRPLPATSDIPRRAKYIQKAHQTQHLIPLTSFFITFPPFLPFFSKNSFFAAQGGAQRPDPFLLLSIAKRYIETYTLLSPSPFQAQSPTQVFSFFLLLLPQTLPLLGGLCQKS